MSTESVRSKFPWLVRLGLIQIEPPTPDEMIPPAKKMGRPRLPITDDERRMRGRLACAALYRKRHPDAQPYCPRKRGGIKP